MMRFKQKFAYVAILSLFAAPLQAYAVDAFKVGDTQIKPGGYVDLDYHQTHTSEGHDEELPDQALAQARADFTARLALVDWAARHGTAAFEKSPRALIELAPIVDALKAYDSEIVVNSMRFKWQGIRAELTQRLNAQAVLSGGGF